MTHDVAIVGGGPAGLSLAIHAARRGLDAVVLDRQKLPADKACGEGLMPNGLRALEVLGVRDRLGPDDCAPFRRIRYVQEDGTYVEGALPNSGGLGIRRTALARVLLQRARELGVAVREQEAVRHHRRESSQLVLRTDHDELLARVLIAADGLHSPLRRAEGLDGTKQTLRRFGLRRHFARAPWSDSVEVHFAEGLEAYVTPCGGQRVGIAFLWEDGRVPERIRFDTLLARFPLLAGQLDGAEPDSKPQGAGPLWQSTRRLISDRFALLGDAAGYVDALTGEGLSLALSSAEVLASVLPDALAHNGSVQALRPYESAALRAFARYERLTRWLLALARRPKLRRQAIGALARTPKVFEALLASALG